MRSSPRVQDLVRQSAGWEFAVEPADRRGAQHRPGQPVPIGRDDLFHRRRVAEQTGRANHVASAAIPAAQGVEAFHQMFAEIGMWAEAEPGAGSRMRLARGAKQTSSLFNEIGRHAGTTFCIGQIERLHRRAQSRNRRAEAIVKCWISPSPLQHHAQYRGQQRAVLARLHLQEQVGLARGFGQARIDDDQLRSLGLRFSDTFARVGRWQR